jgi:hypothetical protein
MTRMETIDVICGESQHYPRCEISVNGINSRLIK